MMMMMMMMHRASAWHPMGKDYGPIRIATKGTKGATKGTKGR